MAYNPIEGILKYAVRSLSAALVMIPLLMTLTLAPAAAHVLKENNGISAVLHVDPDDNPQAGQPTLLQLSFGDAGDKFSLNDCTCSVSVTSDGKTIQSVPLQPAAAGATLAAKATVLFPSVGVYNVIVVGGAKDGAFHAFRLDYLERVAGSVYQRDQAGGGGQALLISAGALVILGTAAVINIKQGGRYRQAAQPGPKRKVSAKGVKK